MVFFFKIQLFSNHLHFTIIELLLFPDMQFTLVKLIRIQNKQN